MELGTVIAGQNRSFPCEKRTVKMPQKWTYDSKIKRRPESRRWCPYEIPFLGTKSLSLEATYQLSGAYSIGETTYLHNWFCIREERIAAEPVIPGFTRKALVAATPDVHA